MAKLNEKKTNYTVFTRVQTEFSTRLFLNGKVLERKKFTKLLGVWLQEDGGWGKNTEETCKAAYQRISMLTKLRYAGETIENLLHIYKQFIRSKLEYCMVAMHSSMSQQQSSSLERCQAVSLRIILQENYVSYEAAMEMTGLETLSARRQKRCLDFSLKSIRHEQNKRFFPRNPNIENEMNIREREEFVVNFGRTKSYQMSAIPYCQRLLNAHFSKIKKNNV